MLRAYMHGFFIDNILYGKAVDAANPFAYEEYRCGGAGREQWGPMC